jgi:UDP-N-acetylglucosamine--N-acetylmuramyl-(pentapeptide) pyrophosphoryl-undecaprenol N-acetylglucosamine transferase
LSYEDSKKYLKDKKRLYLTGNPVRENLIRANKSEAIKKFGLNIHTKTLLILGGSLGAASINTAIVDNLKQLIDFDIQIIWQTGKAYYDKYKNLASEKIWISAFIENMNDAYSACDLVISRAGATSIAEILFIGVPAILVPSPNVAENHQDYNAKSLADQKAAVFVQDEDLNERLFNEVISIISSESRLAEISTNAERLSKPNATAVIAQRAINYVKQDQVN